MKIFLYYPESMKFFGKRACQLFGWERFYPIDSKRLTGDYNVIFWLYHPEDYLVFQQSKVNKFVYWHGSDVYLALQNEARKILKDDYAVHACQSLQQSFILELIGLKPLVRPMFFGDVNKYKFKERSNVIEDVYINVNQGREEEYGLLHFLRASLAFPEKRFHVFGIHEYIPFTNVLYYGRIDEEEYDKITDDFDLYCMLHRNAGTSQSAVKAALRGQIVVSNNRLSFVTVPCHNYGDLINLIDSTNWASNNHLDLNLNQFDWIK